MSLSIPPLLKPLYLYGSLRLTLTHTGDLTHCEYHLLGMAPFTLPIHKAPLFNIVTNLHHFHLYLSDMQHIRLTLYSPTHSETVLLPLNYWQKELTFTHTATLPLAQSINFSVILTLQFDEAIHSLLLSADTIELFDIPPHISPIISPITSKQELNDSTSRDQLQIIQCTKVYPHPHLLRKEEDQKQMEDEIDQLIQQIKNKPYDSSKYINEADKLINETDKLIDDRDIMRATEAVAQSRPPLPEGLPLSRPISQSNHSLEHKPPLPNMNRTATNFFTMTKTNSLIRPVSPSKSNRSGRQPQSGSINLRVHELMMQEPRQYSFLKVYLNQEEYEHCVLSGTLNGEIIAFNNALKIPFTRNLQSLRFQLDDALIGEFELSRLFAHPAQKGIFMVNMVPPMPNLPFTNHSNSFMNNTARVSVSSQSLRAITPTYKTLRIELEYKENVQIVQIYLRIANMSIPMKKCRYKVPFTKESIEFTSEQHINLFPHNLLNRNGNKILLQVWGQNQMVGISEIPLKQVSQSYLQASVSPICLFNSRKDIHILASNKIVGYYQLQVYYGSIQQVQSLINSPAHFPAQEVRVESQRKIEQATIIKYPKSQEPSLSKISKLHEYQLRQQSESESEESNNQFIPAQSAIPTLEISDKPNKLGKSKADNLGVERKEVASKSPPSQKNTPLGQNSTPCSPRVPHPPPVPSRPPQKSLTRQLLAEMKDSLAQMTSEKSFRQLKDSCKAHLLYNFIESAKIMEIFQHMCVPNRKAKAIAMYCMEVTNGMVNVNVFYDMLYELILHGEILEKYVSDRVLGAFCVYKYYEMSKSTLLLSDDVDFQDSRRLFADMDYKLTMRQHNAMEYYLGTQEGRWEQIKIKAQDYLQETAANRYHYQAEEKEVLKLIYQEDRVKSQYPCWNEDDDFIIANMNNRPDPHLEETYSLDCCLEKEYIQSNPNGNLHVLYPPQQTKPQEAWSAPVKQVDGGQYTLRIEGIAPCLDSTECYLELDLTQSVLRVRLCQINLQFDRLKTARELMARVVIGDEQELDGAVQLVKAGSVIAHCHFSVIREVKSVYPLKSWPANQFCGLIHILISR